MTAPLYIGIDPGLQHMGVGGVMVKGNELIYVFSETISPPKKLTTPEKLSFLSERLDAIIIDQLQKNPIGAIALEKVFHHINLAVAVTLGEARGIAMAVAGKHHIPIIDIANRTAKKTLTGSGRADKSQMVGMVKILLPHANPKTDHEADALALALSAGQNQQTTWGE